MKAEPGRAADIGDSAAQGIRVSVQLQDLAVVAECRGGTGCVLGRDSDCDVVIEHPSVSRRHAEIRADGPGWQLRDLGSKNGIRIRGERVDRGDLRSGDWFSLGDVFCRFEIVDADQLRAEAAHLRQRRATSQFWQQRLEGRAPAQALLSSILRGVIELAECRRGVLLAGDRASGMQTLARSSAADDDVDDRRLFAGSRSAIERCCRERRPVFLSAAADRCWLQGQASVVAHGLRSLVCLPLLREGALLGVVYVDTDDEEKIFTALDAELLQAFAERAATTLQALDVGRRIDAMERQLSLTAAQPGEDARG